MMGLKSSKQSDYKYHAWANTRVQEHLRTMPFETPEIRHATPAWSKCGAALRPQKKYDLHSSVGQEFLNIKYRN